MAALELSSFDSRFPSTSAPDSSIDQSGMNRITKVLLVDDDIEFADALLHSLNRLERYDLQWVSTADAAVAQARDFLPDVILLDFMLRKELGSDVYEALRHCSLSEARVVPIIMVSSLADRFHDEENAPDGSEKIRKLPRLQKPFKVEDLDALIEKTIDRGRI